jgi:hypothetical protein
MSWLGRSIGEFGSQVGGGHEIALDWRKREQDIALARVRAQIEQALLPLQIAEMQTKLRQMGQPTNAGLLTQRGGGTAGVTFDPNTAKFSTQTLEPGADPDTVKSKIESMKKNAPREYQGSLQAEIDSIEAGSDPMKALDNANKLMATASAKQMPTGNTQNRVLGEAMDAYERGDLDTYQQKLKQASEMTQAVKPQTPTQWSMRVKAVTDPGPEGDVARQVLKAQEEEQIRLVKARGLAFGQGRLYSLHDYIQADGTPTQLTGFEYLARRDRGEKLTPTNRLSPNVIVGYQRLQSEAGPALQGVLDNIGSLDNASDRAIFARVMKGAGRPDYGQEASWMHNILDQVATDQLSPEGQRFKISLARLADTMGLVRASMALPATDSAMQLTMSMLPGPSTPDAAYGRMQVQSLRGIIVQSAALPMFSNMPNTLSPAPLAPPSVPPPKGFTQRVVNP